MFCRLPFFLVQGRVEKPFRSCRVDCGNRPTLYAIVELLEFLDHAGGARTPGLGAHCGTLFLVVGSFVQNQPK
jgi:hypothetical protein